MAGRIERGDFAGPMLRILWQSLHAFVDENGRRFDFAQDMPEILEFARTTRWAELTAEATNRPLLLDFEAGGDGGCQEELRLFLEDLLEKTGDRDQLGQAERYLPIHLRSRQKSSGPRWRRNR